MNHKESQGITRNHKEPQGPTRNHKGSQGITRDNKEPQGLASLTRNHKVSQGTHNDSRPAGHPSRHGRAGGGEQKKFGGPQLLGNRRAQLRLASPARTHDTNETKRFPGWTHPPNLQHIYIYVMHTSIERDICFVFEVVGLRDFANPQPGIRFRFRFVSCVRAGEASRSSVRAGGDDL